MLINLDSHKIIQEFNIPGHANLIDVATRADVIKLVYEYAKSKNQDPLYFPMLLPFRELNWNWLHDNKTFTTRLATLLTKDCDIRPSLNLMQEIGTLVKSRIPPPGVIAYRITGNLNWNAGDFGDSGSCFWQGRKDIRRAMMESKEFFALQIFEKADNLPDEFDYEGLKIKIHTGPNNIKYRGIARSWLHKFSIDTASGPAENLILFNGYGANWETRKQGRFLATLLGLEMKKIELSNLDQYHGGLYMNGPGYLIGEKENIDFIDSYDFGLKNRYDNRNNASKAIRAVEERTFKRINHKTSRNKIKGRRVRDENQRKIRIRELKSLLRGSKSSHWRTYIYTRKDFLRLLIESNSQEFSSSAYFSQPIKNLISQFRETTKSKEIKELLSHRSWINMPVPQLIKTIFIKDSKLITNSQ